MTRKKVHQSERAIGPSLVVIIDGLTNVMREIEQTLDQMEQRYTEQDVEILDDLRREALRLTMTVEACIDEAEEKTP